MAQDLGNLADYVLNGDNYTQVQPDGSTLEIPTNYQQQIVVPTTSCAFGVDPNCSGEGPRFTWNILDPSCADNTEYCIAHDVTTDLFFFVTNCSYDFSLGEDCFQQCAQALAQLDGTTVDNAFPGWLVELLYPHLLFNELPLLNIDYFFLACPGGNIVIPNFPVPIPITPPPPPTACCTNYSMWQRCCVRI